MASWRLSGEPSGICLRTLLLFLALESVPELTVLLPNFLLLQELVVHLLNLFVLLLALLKEQLLLFLELLLFGAVLLIVCLVENSLVLIHLGLDLVMYDLDLVMYDIVDYLTSWKNRNGHAHVHKANGYTKARIHHSQHQHLCSCCS